MLTSEDAFFRFGPQSWRPYSNTQAWCSVNLVIATTATVGTYTWLGNWSWSDQTCLTEACCQSSSWFQKQLPSASLRSPGQSARSLHSSPHWGIYIRHYLWMAPTPWPFPRSGLCANASPSLPHQSLPRRLRARRTASIEDHDDVSHQVQTFRCKWLHRSVCLSLTYSPALDPHGSHWIPPQFSNGHNSWAAAAWFYLKTPGSYESSLSWSGCLSRLPAKRYHSHEWIPL